MVTPLFDEVALLLAVIAVGIAAGKWHVVRDRRLILSVMRNALKERKAFWIGILTGALYLSAFLVLGGQGGRIHLLFGRVIWNTSPGDVLAGILLALLVMLSMTLFTYGIHMMGVRRTAGQGSIGLTGSLLALLAAFCPWWLPLLTALGGAAGALLLEHFWNALWLFSAAVLVLGILYSATVLKTADGWGWKLPRPS